MAKYFSRIAISIIMTLALCFPAYGWLIYYKPAITVKVVDTHTRKPIKNSVVVVLYGKGPIISGPAGGSSYTFKAREGLTGDNGEVHFPSYLTLMGPNSYETPVNYIVYCPGYSREYQWSLTDPNLVELSQANTWEERNDASRISIPDRVNNQLPTLHEMLKKEEKWLHESKNKAWINYDSKTALISIAKEGRINDAKFLMEHGADVNYSTRISRTSLMEAAREGHSNMLSLLLENGADVNLKSSQNGRTALMEAAREGYSTAVQLLIRAGADPNIKDIDGKTALIEAAEQSIQTAKSESAELDIVKALIIGGTDINYNRQGEMALKKALASNRAKVINALIASGIEINLEDASSGLIFAASNGNIEMAKVLIKNGADINYRRAGFGMMTPLMYAAWRGHLNIVQMLIDIGADVNAQDAQSKTARMLAEEAGYSDIASVLKNIETKSYNK